MKNGPLFTTKLAHLRYAVDKQISQMYPHESPAFYGNKLCWRHIVVGFVEPHPVFHLSWHVANKKDDILNILIQKLQTKKLTNNT